MRMMMMMMMTDAAETARSATVGHTDYPSTHHLMVQVSLITHSVLLIVSRCFYTLFNLIYLII